ncbi:hypothetical protein [Larkinella rosea]|uniref:Uncharacterized protein n=1 Tax=Larkinella rosea TaxID=2025312 RepID=A0A3P1BM19_9BACT|nr:hypothetical protein [Larkinella rosea]RRB02055.1 hypothetical protein EHT25_16320 [Larkinella rosea]
MCKFLLAFFILILGISTSKADDIMKFSVLLDSLSIRTEKVFILIDKVIINDISDSDSWLIENYRKVIEENYDTTYYRWRFPQNKFYICNRPVQITNCNFQNAITSFFPKIIFQNSIEINNSFNNNSALIFSNSLFYGDVKFSNIKNMLLYKCNFFNDVFIELPEKSGINIVNSLFKPKFSKQDDWESLFLSFLSLRGQDVDFVQIVKSKFIKGNHQGLIDFENFSVKDFYFNDNYVEAKILIQRTFFWNTLSISKCQFKSNVIMNSFKLPSDNLFFPFDQIEDLLSISRESGEAIVLKDTIAKITNIELYNGYFIDKMLESLKKLNLSFKNSGDKISADNTFLLSKKIELQQSKLHLKEKISLENSINFSLNYFISWYSDFGTNLTKAFINSILIIISFSLIYTLDFFIESQKKPFKVNRKYISLRNSLNLLIKKLNKNAVTILGKFGISFKKRYYYRKKKMLFLLYFSYTIEVFFIIMHSILLSVNAFFTLGYGELSVMGSFKYVKYIYVIEGLIGWFLLSFFVVSLLAQTIG